VEEFLPVQSFNLSQNGEKPLFMKRAVKTIQCLLYGRPGIEFVEDAIEVDKILEHSFLDFHQ